VPFELSKPGVCSCRPAARTQLQIDARKISTGPLKRANSSLLPVIQADMSLTLATDGYNEKASRRSGEDKAG
jgi:hypothetical protein